MYKKTKLHQIPIQYLFNIKAILNKFHCDVIYIAFKLNNIKIIITNNTSMLWDEQRCKDDVYTIYI